jgi:hypothetical protein
MRARLAFVLVITAARLAGAQALPTQQTQVGLPAQAFAYYRCSCNTSPGGPLASQFTFAPPAARQWNGSVYASTDRDAVVKAQNACTAERRGSLFDCISCRCSR